ncbi:MAG TPA: hypothetical protein VNN20_08620 [Thermodesulfobacteriota bacterium]|nr:hypothetical protein [Thermodesulfobacteriota bacterium]
MKLRSLLKKHHSIFVAISFFIITFIVYFITGEEQPTPYNNFVRLADAFLHGRLHLTENVKWLELALVDGRYYVVPPPMPAILLLPLVAFFGLSTNQTIASVFLGSLNVSLAFLVARELSKNRSIQLWATAMFGFGTIHWWLAATGSVWLFSQVTSVTFLLLAIYATLRNKHLFLVGILLGASFWSRLPTVFSLPFFIVMFVDKWIENPNGAPVISRIKVKPLIHLGLGLSIFVFLNFLYNYLRFSTPLDVSYYLIPGVLEEIWYREGIFDISYIPRHLKAMFWEFPIFLSAPPYVMPSWSGLAIWITTPAFIYALFAGIRNRLALGCWLSIIPIALVLFMHGTWGFSQFGYRFAVDFYPFLYLLTVKGMGDRIRWHHRILITLGVLVNLCGVLWVNKFGWVRY